MKTSNIFLLIALIPIVGSLLGSTIFGKYISKDEYDQNLEESIKSLETQTYDHKTEIFDQPFDRILIKNTQPSHRAYQDEDTYNRNTTYNKVRWIKSEKCGLKVPHHNDFIQRSSIENNTLVIYTDYPNQLALGTITFYSPSLNHVEIENAGPVQLINSVIDSLSITVISSQFEIGGASSIKKLAIQANNYSAIKVEAPYIGEARYNLSANSSIRNMIDSCNAMYIHGDTSSHAVIVPYFESSPARSTYRYLRFNNELGNIRIESTHIHQIDGYKTNLSLNMSAQQIEQTLAVLASD